MATQLSIDLKAIVADVTGKKAKRICNDKRKSFNRRYKFCGVLDTTSTQIDMISTLISKKHPDLQFVVKGASFNPAVNRYHQHYIGLTVKII